MMMLFAVHDAAADRFIDPFPSPTIEVAIRSFRGACESDGHQFGQYPEDYSLWHIGEFDPQLGELKPMKASKIAMASSYVHGAQLDFTIDEKEA